VPELRPGRAESEVEGEPLAGRGDRTGQGEDQLVEAETALLEGERFPREVSRGIHAEVQPDLVEIGDSGELHRHRVGLGPGLDGDLVIAEVAAERLVQAGQGGAQPGRAVVEDDGAVVDAEPP
jgi:hypothetical protein